MQRIVAIFVSLALSIPSIGLASTELPANVVPGRLFEQFHQLPTPRSQVNVELSEIVHAPVLSTPDTYSFTLCRVQVIGQGISDTRRLDHFTHKWIGKTVTIAQMRKIADEITQYYVSKGYLLTKAIIPEQDFSKGSINIMIVAGYIDKVTIDDDIPIVHPLLCNLLEGLKASRPLLHCDLQHFLLLANDLPGLRVSMEIVSVPDKAGAAELILHVHSKRLEATLGFDNHGSRWMGPQQFFGKVGVYHMLRGGDNSHLKAIISSNGQELQLIRLVHQTPLGCDGMRLNFSGEYGHNRPGFNLEDQDVEGHGAMFAVSVERPFIRCVSHNFYGALGFKLVNSTSDIAGELDHLDRARMVEASGHLDFIDIWQGTNLIVIKLTHGLDVFNATSESDDQSISGAPGVFTKAKVFVSRLQPLSPHYSLYIAGNGQYAFNSLLYSEQMGYGGDNFGRAYNFSEIQGDSGLLGKVELRYDTRPSSLEFKNAQYFVVYDGGVVWQRRATSEMNQESATSVGVGVRVHYTEHFAAEVEFDRALTREILAEDIALRSSHRYRGFFRIAFHD